MPLRKPALQKASNKQKGNLSYMKFPNVMSIIQEHLKTLECVWTSNEHNMLFSSWPLEGRVECQKIWISCTGSQRLKITVSSCLNIDSNKTSLYLTVRDNFQIKLINYS